MIIIIVIIKGKRHTDNFGEVVNDSNNDDSRPPTSLPVWDLKKYWSLQFCCTKRKCGYFTLLSSILLNF